MNTLQKLSLKGFRSIRDVEVEFGNLNILIGANGAGKSNLISFFKLLNEMMGGRLQLFVADSGQAHSILHYGPKVTPQMEAQLSFQTDGGQNVYEMRLFHASGDTLIFAEETLSFHGHGFAGPPKVTKLGPGHTETEIGTFADRSDVNAKVLRHLLNHCRVYQFHDTSQAARVRQHCYIGDNRWLMHDAGNLAAVLYSIREEGTGVYPRIVSTIRQFAPFFGDFDLEPTGASKRDIILNWREKDSDQLFGPHQFSDGTLRAICLVTLLMQPVDDLPHLIVIDEPELGLHPSAQTILAGLLKIASHHCQILVATQSATLLDHFDASDIIVVDREPKESKFSRLNEEKLEQWLEEYSLGEVWQKNVIGGGPFS